MNSLRTLPAKDEFALLGVILILPLLGAFVNGVFGKRLGKDAVRPWRSLPSGCSFLASVVSFLSLPSRPARRHGGQGPEAAVRLRLALDGSQRVTGRRGASRSRSASASTR
jgi:hypothetical protein